MCFPTCFPYGDGVFGLPCTKPLTFQQWLSMLLLREELVCTIAPLVALTDPPEPPITLMLPHLLPPDTPYETIRTYPRPKRMAIPDPITHSHTHARRESPDTCL